MQLHPFRATFPKLEYITSPDSFFRSVKEDYSDFAESGFFQTSEEPSFYIYHIQKAEKLFSGLISSIDLQETSMHHIKPHEQTLASKEQKQIQLLLRRQATVKPVLMTYKAVDKINFALHQMCQHSPLLHISLENTKTEHLIWEVKTPEDKALIQQLFQEHVSDVYIADGHHRCATASHLMNNDKLSPFRHLLCAFFPSTDLVIHDFNRVVDAFSQYSRTLFMARLSTYCDIKVIDQAYKPRVKHEMLLLIQDEWYQLRWKERIFTELGYSMEVLDSQLLNDLILKGILGLKDVTGDQRLEYIEGPRGLEGIRKAVETSPNKIGFALYPVQTQELFDLADQHYILPPKSTWFEPRLVNGLINYHYDIE